MINESFFQTLSGRLSSLEQEMSAPGAAGNHRKFRELADEYARIKRILERADICFKFKRELDQHRSLINDPGADPDIKELARDELAELERQLAAADKELTISLLKPDPNDARNAIVEIRAGTGGDEAALFAGDLFRMYSHFAEAQGWKVSVMDAGGSNAGGYKEIVFSVEGTDVYRLLKYESGGHRVQRVPVTEAQGRIHTSAATVAVFPEAEENDDIDLKPEDVRVDIFCSSGPGGQSVNTTYSAVRITHLPTGIVAQSQDERSQSRNKDKAMRVLRARILDMRQREESERMATERRSLIGSGDRSQRIRTYNFPQNRLTDHRVNLTLYSLDRLIEGDLKPLLDTLYEQDINLKIEEATETWNGGQRKDRKTT